MLTAETFAAAVASAWLRDVETCRGPVGNCSRWSGEPGWDAARAGR